MLSALDKMHKACVSEAKFALQNGYDIVKYIRKLDKYTIYQVMNDGGRYCVETDLTEEQFIEKVKQYL